ncbi:MAG: response regulator [Alphaproteobacteria bacterium]|nr:response regulator [Alphaproteobacteria bacterium]MCW5743937.1 response regulator [Alphaproteobacteria bacterium]
MIFAPQGRDAEVARALLKEAGIAALICADLAALERAIDERTSFVILTEGAAAAGDLRGIAKLLAAQPAWSDLPFIVLTRRGGDIERNPAAARLSQVLGNVTFLERPFHPTTFVSLARTAVRSRRRQYEARTHMRALAEGERRLQSALQAGRLGSWELDLDSRQLTATEACKALYGRQPHEGLSWDELVAAIHPEDRGWAQDALRRSIEVGGDYAIEYRTVWRDGSVQWAEIRARVVRDDGRAARLIGVSADITERKTAEERLHQLNETLEDRVAERTRELEEAHKTVVAEMTQRQRAEDQLRQAQKMEMIGQLTGGIAHDFNNLLMAVMGNLELLRKRVPPDARIVRLIEGAAQGAQRGAVLTQRLLAFARQQELQVEPSDVAALVRGMSDLLARSVGARIEIAIEVPDGLPRAMIDANQVELALLNLAVNARDAMPEGGSLSIRAQGIEAPAGTDLAPGTYVRLSVADTGCGMDAETLAKATEPFFSTKEVGKGTGLGLSMVHGLAVQLGGALRLSSEPGKGTVAELWFPATGGDAPRRDESPAAAPGATPAQGLKILVVDDDVLISMSTVGMLEDLGHEAIEVNSGERALELLAQDRPFDLMITDYAMPRMTGVQLARKARDARPGLPILLATGYAETPAGTDLPRLSKPYHQAQLGEEIARLMAARASA